MSDIKDIDLIVSAMKANGFHLAWCKTGNMDSGSAEFVKGQTSIQIMKDKGQWMLAGSRKLLEPLGLFKAFDDTLEFRAALLDYVKNDTL